MEKLHKVVEEEVRDKVERMEEKLVKTRDEVTELTRSHQYLFLQEFMSVVQRAKELPAYTLGTGLSRSFELRTTPSRSPPVEALHTTTNQYTTWQPHQTTPPYFSSYYPLPVIMH